MKYDKVTIIGVAICVLSFFGIMWMQSRRAMQLREMAAEQERLAQAAAAEEAATQKQSSETTPAANAATPSENAPAVANPPAATTVVAMPAADGQTVTPFGPDAPRPFMDANTLVALQRGDEQIFRIDRSRRQGQGLFPNTKRTQRLYRCR